MFKKIIITDKKFTILKLAIGLLILIAVILTFNPVRITRDSLNQHFFDTMFQNFENMGGGNNKEPIKSITVNNMTLNIYGIVFENQEIILKYDLMKGENTRIPEQALASAVVSCKDQRDNYSSEYNAKSPGNSSVSLTVLTNEKIDTAPNYLNKPVKISVYIIYKENHDSQGFTQDFEFEYTPTQIYAEKIINVDREFSYSDKSMNIKRIILNGLYMRIECDYKRETSTDMWCLFKAYDELGEEAGFLGASASETTSEYFYNNISEKAGKLYLHPSIHQYDANRKEKITTLDEKIEITLSR